MQAIAKPTPASIPPRLEDWTGPVIEVIELENRKVHGIDLGPTKRLEVESCTIINVQLAGTRFDKLQLGDTALRHIEAAGMHAPEATWLRVTLSDSRLTGADFGEALLEDCVFENVKLDESGFRFATLKRVRFSNCVLRNADFSGAKFAHVSFESCEFEGVNFDNATCTTVDLRDENLSEIKGVFGLKGATVSSEQLVQLAPLLAAEAGLDVDFET